MTSKLENQKFSRFMSTYSTSMIDYVQEMEVRHAKGTL